MKTFHCPGCKTLMVLMDADSAALKLAETSRLQNERTRLLKSIPAKGQEIQLSVLGEIVRIRGSRLRRHLEVLANERVVKIRQVVGTTRPLTFISKTE